MSARTSAFSGFGAGAAISSGGAPQTSDAPDAVSLNSPWSGAGGGFGGDAVASPLPRAVRSVSKDDGFFSGIIGTSSCGGDDGRPPPTRNSSPGRS